jgi:ABC-type multidrug transport system fused ATPase/permease subunit
MKIKTSKHIKELKEMLKCHPGDIFCALLCTGLASGLMLLVPNWLKKLVSTTLPKKDLGLLSQHLILGFLLILAIQILLFWKDFIRMRLSHRLGTSMRQKLFEKILEIPFAKASEYRSGDLISRLSNDIKVFQEGLMKGIFRFIPNAIILVFLILLMGYHSIQLSLITMIFIIPMAWTLQYFVKKIRLQVKISQTKLSLINNLVEESIRGVAEIKAFRKEKEIADRFQERNQNSLRAHIKLDKVTALNPVIVLMVTVASIFTLILICTWMVSEGMLTMEELIAFLTCLALAYSPIQEITGSFGFISRIYAVMDRFEEIFHIPTSLMARNGLPDFPEIEGHIRFQHIHFSYDHGFRLEDINLEIQAGETIAFVGPSGAGKSSLLHLIPGFLEPEAGEILVDRKEVKKFNLQSIRRQVGYVTQEPILFDSTLLENISFARPEASREEILNAAKAAHVQEFAQKLPQGYDTPIGPYGCKLSVGQRQRIAIARALLLDPRILILDEPTSSLDNESEFLLKDSLKKLCKDRTTLIVAHRLSTIQNAHRIVVLENGKIVEIGTHEDLLQKKGLYHKLFLYQDIFQ